MHRNFVRDAMYGILHHCEQQRSHRHTSRHPMAQTGQIPDAVAEGLVSLGMQLLEAAMTPAPSTDVLSAATSAYQQGKITKSQFMAVINALDEATYEQNAYTVPNSSLDLYRR